MVIDELSTQTWAKVCQANQTQSAYPARPPTTTMPAGDGIIGMGLLAAAPGNYAPRGVCLLPFGADASTHTFSFKVLGWRPTSWSKTTALWVPTTLLVCQATLGTAVGVAGADLDTTQFFATTITCSVGPTFITSGAGPVVPDEFLASPGGNDIGAVFVRSLGFPLLEVLFTTGGIVTSCNALYAKF